MGFMMLLRIADDNTLRWMWGFSVSRIIAGFQVWLSKWQMPENCTWVYYYSILWWNWVRTICVKGYLPQQSMRLLEKKGGWKGTMVLLPISAYMIKLKCTTPSYVKSILFWQVIKNAEASIMYYSQPYSLELIQHYFSAIE